MKNPILNAVLAGAYILVLVTIAQTFAKPNTPDSFLDPVIALSVLTLSAAVMGYLFLAEPLRKYLDGQKAEAAHFFLKTVGAFAVITLIVGIIRVTFF